jgi:hypothetical protein
MPHVRRTLSALAVVLALADAARAESLFTLTEDGQTYLYRARPGDHPSAVAEMFGIGPKDLPTFLTANGIVDPTRVGAGFVYRIPNDPVRALTQRTTVLQAENARLVGAASADRERMQGLVRTADESHEAAAEAEARAARLARIAALWPWARAGLLGLLAAAIAAAYTAVAAIRSRAQAERYARTLARELDEKRRSALAERQESARRILDLEARVHALETQLGPRVVISGRSGS